MDLLQEHIDQLCRNMNTDKRQEPFLPGMMYVEYEPPYIEGPTIKEQKDYYVMLHELGHVYHGHTQGRPPYENRRFYFDNGVLKSEAQAWEFALDNALEEEVPTEETRRFMWKICLGSYYSSAVFQAGRPYRLLNGNRHHVEFIFDEPDAFFWKVRDRILNGLEK